MSAPYAQRLRKELRDLKKNPVQNITASPRENNILEWHYVIEGPKNSPFEGGWYHGVVIFPKEYPFKPPSIQMTTPNGRFKVTAFVLISLSFYLSWRLHSANPCRLRRHVTKILFIATFLDCY
jgi:ubiquitin-conjugating enzyme E2 J2